ncbi:MAG: DNA polymerase III subunit gamma/tau [Desulfobulbaceae bacterium]|nr:DNA polymerase III subunit gamma/tau [Desulfobulbaceae bacterium]
MSYLVLARKWRPQDFSQVVGQAAVVRILRNALRRQRVPHAMLFSGVRGVGKTTLARIMAKALNCARPDDNPPCCQCDSCREIAAGASLDLHEIDGASNRGIQEIRDLKENIRFLPSKSRYKIIIIDEVHMLTTEAFNALLKTLEEPPAHVIFMFATTESHKIPVTILSRCQRYELKRVPFAELRDFFAQVAEKEGVEISLTALEMVAREAAGSVRDGLSLLDQVFSFGDARMTDEDVRQVLGLVDSQVFFRLTGALLEGELGAALVILDQVCAAGADLKRFLADLLLHVRGLVIARVVKTPAALLDGSDREIAGLAEMARRYSAETLYRLLEQLLRGAGELQYAVQPRLALEMVLARAVQAGQVVPVAELIARLDRLLAEGGGRQEPAEVVRPGGNPEPVVVSGVIRAAEKKTAPPEPTPEPAPSITPLPEAPQLEPPEIVREAAVPVAEPLAAYLPQESVTPGVCQKDVQRDWDEFIGYVKERQAWMAPILKMCARVRRQDNELFLKYENISDGMILQDSEHKKLLTELAQDFFQCNLMISIKKRPETAGEGDIDEAAGIQEERRSLGGDPLVQMATEVFGGQVVSVRTGPGSRVEKGGGES